MSVVKIGPKHQVTIPKEIFDELYLQPGDFLEAVAQDGKIVMTPKQLTNKAPAPPLTKKEQQVLPRVKEKISRIQTDLANSRGLDDNEVKLAAKLGLIDPDQAWWWGEEWQKGKREVEKEIAQNETSGPFKSVHGLIEHLNKSDISEAWNDEERSKKGRFSLQGIFKGGEPVSEEDIDEAIKEDDNGYRVDN